MFRGGVFFRTRCTSLESTFNGLQFRRWQYGSIFIRSAVIASETREMSRNSKRIWPYSSSTSSKVIDLGVNGKPICDFLLVINCNFSFSLVWRARSGEPIRISGWNLPAKLWWKFHNPNFNRFYMIPPSDGRTDRRTGDSIRAIAYYAVGRKKKIFKFKLYIDASSHAQLYP